MSRVANPNPAPFEYITLSFRVVGKVAKLVHQAAAKHEVSTAHYMRDLVIPAVCAELGVPVPDYNAVSAASIAELAAAQGITVQEFTARAVRELAEKLRKSTPPKRPSEIRLRAAGR